MTLYSDPLEACVAHSHEINDDTIREMDAILDVMPVLDNKRWRALFEPLPLNENKPLPSNIKAPTLDLKPLPSELKYVYLGRDETYPVVISSHLDEEQESRLIATLLEHKSAIGWSIADLKGIDPLICTHRIHLEENAKTSRQPQR